MTAPQTVNATPTLCESCNHFHMIVNCNENKFSLYVIQLLRMRQLQILFNGIIIWKETFIWMKESFTLFSCCCSLWRTAVILYAILAVVTCWRVALFTNSKTENVLDIVRVTQEYQQHIEWNYANGIRLLHMRLNISFHIPVLRNSSNRIRMLNTKLSFRQIRNIGRRSEKYCIFYTNNNFVTTAIDFDF